jgi:hypothetical protein
MGAKSMYYWLGAVFCRKNCFLVKRAQPVRNSNFALSCGNWNKPSAAARCLLA